MCAVFKKEFKSYFNNMIGYVFIAFILVVTGIYATVLNFLNLSSNFEYVLANTSFSLLIVVPLLTMGTLSTERKYKTDQLLLTAPVSITKIVLGKYFAMIAVLAIPILIMCAYPIILSFYGTVNLLSAFGAILGLWFLGCAILAMGMFLSGTTESQVIAAVVTILSSLLLFLIKDIANIIPASASASLIAFTLTFVALALVIYATTRSTTLSLGLCIVGELVLFVLYFTHPAPLEGAFPAMLSSLAVFGMYDNFVSGMFDLTTVVFYVSFAFFFCFLSVRTIEKRRWS